MTRTLLLTGASGGIGQALALHLAREEQARLILLGRDVKALKELAGAVRAVGGSAESYAGDLRDRTWLHTVARDLDGVDGLVAGAGTSGVTPVDRDSDDRFDTILATNLTGAWNTVRAFVPRMGKGGRIVLVSSVLGRFGVPGYAAYCASKHGLLGLTKALALELIPRGIYVNAVAPGWVDTDMAAAGIQNMAKSMGVEPAEARRRAERATPLGRFLQPDEIAHGIAFLLAPTNTTMVGKCLTLDGGSVQD